MVHNSVFSSWYYYARVSNEETFFIQAQEQAEVGVSVNAGDDWDKTGYKLCLDPLSKYPVLVRPTRTSRSDLTCSLTGVFKMTFFSSDKDRTILQVG